MQAKRATNAGEELKVEKENTPLRRERIEHSTQSVVSVLGEGSSRRVSSRNELFNSSTIQLFNLTWRANPC